MAALRGQPQVDDGLWNVRKTLYTILSEIIHGRGVTAAGLLALVTTATLRQLAVKDDKGGAATKEGRKSQ